jgi:hypothetical protein
VTPGFRSVRSADISSPTCIVDFGRYRPISCPCATTVDPTHPVGGPVNWRVSCPPLAPGLAPGTDGFGAGRTPAGGTLAFGDATVVGGGARDGAGDRSTPPAVAGPQETELASRARPSAATRSVTVALRMIHGEKLVSIVKRDRVGSIDNLLRGDTRVPRIPAVSIGTGVPDLATGKRGARIKRVAVGSVDLTEGFCDRGPIVSGKGIRKEVPLAVPI